MKPSDNTDIITFLFEIVDMKHDSVKRLVSYTAHIFTNHISRLLNVAELNTILSVASTGDSLPQYVT